MKKLNVDASLSLAGRATLIMCVFVLVTLLSSCQHYPSVHGTVGYSYRPQVVPIYYEVPPSAKRSSPQHIHQSYSHRQSIGLKGKRMPKPQSSIMLPPVPSHGYHARLDKTRYPSMNNLPFYRVVGADGGSTYLSETVFWEWHRRATKSGVYVKVFDPYDPSAPAYRP